MLVDGPELITVDVATDIHKLSMIENATLEKTGTAPEAVNPKSPRRDPHIP